MTTMKKILFIILAVLIITSINAQEFGLWDMEPKYTKTYYKNGNLKTEILHIGRTKNSERTYWKNGNMKTYTIYGENGKFDGKSDSRICLSKKEKPEKCKRWKHGCTAKSYSCIRKK